MQLGRVIISAVLVLSLAYANLLGVSFKNERPDAGDRQLVGPDHESVTSSADLPRENRSGRRASEPAGFAKSFSNAWDLSFAEGRFSCVSNPDSPHVITNDLTLVSLHCRLTV